MALCGAVTSHDTVALRVLTALGTIVTLHVLTPLRGTVPRPAAVPLPAAVAITLHVAATPLPLPRQLIIAPRLSALACHRPYRGTPIRLRLPA